MAKSQPWIGPCRAQEFPHWCNLAAAVFLLARRTECNAEVAPIGRVD
jgi:hypothetical protein